MSEFEKGYPHEGSDVRAACEPTVEEVLKKWADGPFECPTNPTHKMSWRGSHCEECGTFVGAPKSREQLLVALITERTMHNAWLKRATEDERELTELRANIEARVQAAAVEMRERCAKTCNDLIRKAPTDEAAVAFALAAETAGERVARKAVNSEQEENDK